jgi:hypothetical protein
MTSDATITFYSDAADAADVGIDRIRERAGRHGNRIGAAHGPAWHPVTNPGGFRAYARLTKYSRVTPTYLRNIYGHLRWLYPKQLAIYRVIMAELAKGNDLSITKIAQITGASRSHVSVTIHSLARWRFIEITGIVLGRAGKILAHLVKAAREMFGPYNARERLRVLSDNVLRKGPNISARRPPRYPEMALGMPLRTEFDNEMAAFADQGLW